MEWNYSFFSGWVHYISISIIHGVIYDSFLQIGALMGCDVLAEYEMLYMHHSFETFQFFEVKYVNVVPIQRMVLGICVLFDDY